MKIIKYAAIDIGSNAIRMLISNVIFQDKKSWFIEENISHIKFNV